MARNPKKMIRGGSRKQVLNLSDVRDTSETSQGPKEEEPLHDEHGEFVEVPPPFQGERSQVFITRSEVTFGWKIAGIVAGIFIVVVVPVVWFVSSLNSNVQTMQSDLNDVQKKN